jgi:hypothetical protein
MNRSFPERHRLAEGPISFACGFKNGRKTRPLGAGKPASTEGFAGLILAGRISLSLSRQLGADRFIHDNVV